MPTGPIEDAPRRSSDSSISESSGSPVSDRRRSSAYKFANLEALKRPQDEASVNRRSSLQDSYGKVGVIGTMWNNFTRGPAAPKSPPQQMKEPRDISTLRSE